jgi:hypothetical protein
VDKRFDAFVKTVQSLFAKMVLPHYPVINNPPQGE